MNRTYYSDLSIKEMLKRETCGVVLSLCCQEERERCKREQPSCLKHCRKITVEIKAVKK